MSETHQDEESDDRMELNESQSPGHSHAVDIDFGENDYDFHGSFGKKCETILTKFSLCEQQSIIPPCRSDIAIGEFAYVYRQ